MAQFGNLPSISAATYAAAALQINQLFTAGSNTTLWFWEDGQKLFKRNSNGTDTEIGGGGGGGNITLQEFDISYTDFQPFAGANNEIVIGQFAAGSIPVAAKWKQSIKFLNAPVSGGIQTALVYKTPSTPGFLNGISILNIFPHLETDPGDFVGAYSTLQITETITDQSNPTDIWCQLFNGGIPIDDLIQGEFHLWLWSIEATL